MSAISRRGWITAGLTAAAGATGLTVAARMVARHGLIPPDSGGIYGIGETLNYASHRLMRSLGSSAREFDRSQITPKPRVNYPLGPPADEAFKRLQAGGFADWRLTVDGLVGRPVSLSLTDLKAANRTSQITHQACEEGWSYIAEWTGVRLSEILQLAAIRPEAQYVVYHSLQAPWWDSIDIDEAMHPQTLLAYGMNGQDLPAGHGAPLKIKVPRQLGYKNVKHLARIQVTDSLKNVGNGLGSPAPEVGFAWYAGI